MANIGAYIKSIVDQIKIDNMDEFCKTHLNMGKQSFYKNLKKTSLNSDLILRYSKVFNQDFFAHFYEEEPLKTFKDREEKAWLDKIADYEKEIKRLTELQTQMQDHINTQKVLIEHLERGSK